MKSPILLLRAFFTDVKRLEPGVKGLDRDFATIEKRVTYEGISFLTNTLPSFDKAVLNGLKTGRFASPTGFKLSRGTKLPRFLGGLLGEIFHSSSGLLRHDANPNAVKCVRELCCMFKKLALSPKKSDELSSKEIDKFFLNDEICAGVSIPDHMKTSLRIASRFVLKGLHSFLDYELLGKHGPGAVADGVTSNQKWQMLFDLMSNSHDFEPDDMGLGQFFVNCYGLVDPNQLELFPRSYHQRIYSGGPIRSSAKLVTVPKNSTSVRLITVEPLHKQFMQQSLNRVLRNEIKRCRVLSRSLALTDQSKSQKLALEGSLTGEWATIDLKSASDLLSNELVKLIFQDKSLFSGLLQKARSETVQHEGIHTGLAKFAGMGNATTFPVQSVCFAVIGIAAIMHVQGKPWTTANVVAASDMIRVYGDDIAVRSDFARQVVDWLEKAGLIVNLDKSFLEGDFRESCGVDAFRGYDVTPVYVRHHPDRTAARAESIASFVSLSNQYFVRGLYSVSRFFEDLVEEVLGTPLPLVTSNSPGLGWFTRKEAFTPNSWCNRLQRPIAKTFALVTRKTSDRLDGYPALLKFFHTAEERCGDPSLPLVGGKDHLSKSDIRFRTRIRGTWVAY